MRSALLTVLAAALLGSAVPSASAAVPEIAPALLTGRAVLPALAYQPGPPAGAAVRPRNGIVPPFPAQPLPGFSALLDAGAGELWAMPDNGFGGRSTSKDFLLRIYRIRPDLKTSSGGSGTIAVTGAVTLSDPSGHVPFPLTRTDRVLTGADFDPESLALLPDGTFWIGEEYGPFLLHVDATGAVLAPPVTMPGVVTPNNPTLADPTMATQPAGKGFEAMAMDPTGRYLYPMLEGALRFDPIQRRRLMREFDTTTRAFTERRWTVLADDSAPGALIADLAALDEHRFVLIERDNSQGAQTRHKKVYLVDLRVRDAAGNLAKRLVVDLRFIADPGLLSWPPRPGEYGVGPLFSFPLQSVESLTVRPGGRLLIANDNNFPSSNGRASNRDRPDDVELIEVRAPALDY
ncbi:MAG: esterase-like activity of phytase family protein [Sporichthyaceae bacterium]